MTDTYTGEDMLDKLIARIVQLDHADEQGKPDEKQYCRERAPLRDEAKAKLGSSQQP